MTDDLSMRPGVNRRTRARRLAAAATASLIALAGLASPAGASNDDEALPPLGFGLVDVRVDARLMLMDVDGPELRAAAAAYEQALFDLAETARLVRQLTAELESLGNQRAKHLAALDDARADLRRASLALDQTEDAIRELVISGYMDGSSPAERALLAIEPSMASEAIVTKELVDSGSDVLLRRRAGLMDEVAAAQRRIGATHERLSEISKATLQVQVTLDGAKVRGFSLAQSIPRLEQEYLEARLTSVIRGTDLPLIALDAYLKAADRMAQENPGCRVTWFGIAGVGRVESNHGRHGNRKLLADGTSSNPILGLTLDGQAVDNYGQAVASIPDTDNGVFDGDPVHDRAVGPMQFIPSTWARWGADGNDDGVADPHNIYDAALAAARYLCAVSGDMYSEPGMRRAYHGYNHSDPYVQQVYELAVRYASIRIPQA